MSNDTHKWMQTAALALTILLVYGNARAWMTKKFDTQQHNIEKALEYAWDSQDEGRAWASFCDLNRPIYEHLVKPDIAKIIDDKRKARRVAMNGNGG